MLNDKLKELREQQGLNKKDFASFLGLKYTTYNNYETVYVSLHRLSDFGIRKIECFN